MIPDSTIEYIERLIGIKLFDYQKECLNYYLYKMRKCGITSPPVGGFICEVIENDKFYKR